MKALCSLLLMLSVSFCIAQQADYADDQLILKYKTQQDAGTESAYLRARALKHLNESYRLQSLRLVGNKAKKRTFIYQFAEPVDIKKATAAYLATGLFEYVEPNYIGQGHGTMGTTPNDQYFLPRQWSHVNDGSFPLSNATEDADIDTDLAWDLTQGDPNLLIAILDSGMKLDHPEVAGRIWQNTGENADGADTDANGYADDLNGGWDFANEDNDPTDDHGHGTNVAGICLATGNNNIGYAGMNWYSQIMICKILDDENFGFYSWWADAIYYAVDNGADVINMSVGGNGASNLLEEAINYAYNSGVPVVVSTGNQNSVIQYPARYEHAFAIGSTDADDTRSVPFFWNESSGSNFGPELDFVAPGNYIYGLRYNSNTSYGTYWGGTSQAAPHVCGLISLLYSVKPGLSVDEIRTILEETAEDQVGDAEDTPGWDPYYGHGRINAFEALSHSLLSNATYRPAKSTIDVSPNPVENGKPLIISGLEPGVAYQVNWYTVNGRQCGSERVEAMGKELELRMIMTPGLYLLEVTDVEGRERFVERVVVW